MKHILAHLAFLFVAACAGSATNPADANRNRLATVAASYGTVQSTAEAYIARPPCSRTPKVVLCSDPSTVRTIQAADRTAFTAIDRANNAIKANPSDPSVASLITGAAEAVSKFKSVTPTKEGT
jgi:hypothetical protein